jgi:glucosamine--fructose-6-phosphate aminotransferase (isomerizing)
MEHALVIGISQSGQAPDVAEYLEQAKGQSALTVAITNEEGSRITQSADFTVFCHAHKEKSVAATKTYTSTLAALYMLSAELAGDGERLQKLRAVPGLMKDVLGLEQEIADRVQRYRYMDECFVLARGINLGTAFEASLKMAETSYIGAKPFSAADLMHGPIAMIHEDMPCFMYAPDGKAFPAMADTIGKIKDRGAETIVYASNDAVLEGADTHFKMPSGVDELLSPLVYIVAGQLFAYHLAAVKGNDPDHPRGLKKVTLTR